METTAHKSVASPPDVASGGDDVITYRSVSLLSLTSLLLGLAAPLCLTAPLLLVIPLFGIAVAWMAMTRIASSEGAMIGRTAALVGLGLCVASLATAVGRSVITRQLLSWQARAVALEWTALVQAGDLDRAYQLTVESSREPPPPPPINAPGGGEPPPDPRESFHDNPVVTFLAGSGSQHRVRYVADLKYAADSSRQAYVEQEFSVSSPREEPAAPDVTLRLTLQRIRNRGDAAAHWIVADYQSDDLSVTAHDDHGHDHVH